MSNYLEDGVLNHTLGGAALAQPAQWWIQLVAESPVDSGTLVPVPTGVLPRVRIYPIGSGSTPRFLAPTDKVGGGRECLSDGLINFGAADGDAGRIVGAYIYDAEAAGNIVHEASVTAAKTVLDGDRYEIPSGGLAVDMSQRLTIPA